MLSAKPSIGTHNYKAKDKNIWRRKVWKAVAKRTESPTRSKVLYLAAEQDLDRAEAIRVGFRPNNLVAVDLRRSVVDSLRSKNKLAFHGSLVEAAMAAPGEFDVIHADLCSGLTHDAFNTFVHCFAALSGDGVLVLNLQRGRERGHDFEQIQKMQSLPTKSGGKMTHRGDLVLNLFTNHIIHEFGGPNRGSLSDDYTVSDAVPVSQYNQMAIQIWRTIKPVCSSYDSPTRKGYKFDTLIVTRPASFQILSTPKTGNGVRQMAAVKAVQTMRKRGKLLPSPIK